MRSTKTIAQTSNKGKNRRRIISALDQKQTTPLEEDLLNRPVESVTYRDILKFLEKVNKAHKINLRLPTEAEWELAAGDVDSQPILDIAWCCENSGGSTHLVGQKLPNHFGLYDMLGNVWEWTSTKDLGGHVLRGGSWYFNSSNLRASTRSRLLYYWSLGHGFRCAQNYTEGQKIPKGWSLIPGNNETESFLIKKHQTTQREWLKMMRNNPSYFKL